MTDEHHRFRFVNPVTGTELSVVVPDGYTVILPIEGYQLVLDDTPLLDRAKPDSFDEWRNGLHSIEAHGLPIGATVRPLDAALEASTESQVSVEDMIEVRDRQAITRAVKAVHSQIADDLLAKLDEIAFPEGDIS